MNVITIWISYWRRHKEKFPRQQPSCFRERSQRIAILWKRSFLYEIVLKRALPRRIVFRMIAQFFLQDYIYFFYCHAFYPSCKLMEVLVNWKYLVSTHYVFFTLLLNSRHFVLRSFHNFLTHSNYFFIQYIKCR